jgi:hypothetical protein
VSASLHALARSGRLVTALPENGEGHSLESSDPSIGSEDSGGRFWRLSRQAQCLVAAVAAEDPRDQLALLQAGRYASRPDAQNMALSQRIQAGDKARQAVAVAARKVESLSSDLTERERMRALQVRGIPSRRERDAAADRFDHAMGHRVPQGPANTFAGRAEYHLARANAAAVADGCCSKGPSRLATASEAQLAVVAGEQGDTGVKLTKGVVTVDRPSARDRKRARSVR